MGMVLNPSRFTAVGGGVSYGAFNPLYSRAGAVLSNSNRTVTHSADPGFALSTDVKNTGKWRYEITIVAGGSEIAIGLIDPTLQDLSGARGLASYGYGFAWYKSTGNVYFNTTANSSGPHMTVGVTPPGGFTTGDVLAIEVDIDAGSVSFQKNGAVVSTVGAGYITAGRLYAPAIVVGSGAAVSVNFGNAAWAYTPTSGYTGWTAFSGTKTGRYWRVSQKAGTNDPHMGCAELQHRLVSGGANQIGSGTISASSAEPSWPIGNAIDGNPSTAFFSLWNSPLFHWIKYDYGVGVSKQITEITYANRNDSGGDYPTALSVEYSNDGATWYPAISVGGLTFSVGEVKTFTWT